MLPNEPETLESLQARFQAALEPVYCQDDFNPNKHDPAKMPLRSGQQRKHVFDCEDGMRLIISRDRYEDGGVDVHVSASFHSDTPLDAMLDEVVKKNGVPAVKRAFCEAVEKRFHEIARDADGLFAPYQMELLIWSKEKGIPHWKCRTEPARAS
jgi:hypothetical protein